VTTTFTVKERCTAWYRATVQGDGAALPASSLDTLTLTLYDRDTGTILNSRNAQDVLNKANVTVGEDGALVWELQPADNVIVSDGKSLEAHVALFTWTWGSGKSGRHEVPILVENLAKVV
jgi:hypothetical protein